MPRHRCGLGTHTRLVDRFIETADLSTGRTLKHALHRLEGIRRRRPETYATAWLEEVADIDIRAIARCERVGRWRLQLGFPCDGQEAERSRRQRALSDHLHAVDGDYEKVVGALRMVGREWDDRDISTRDIFAALKPFLETGGKVFVGPEHSLRINSNNALLLTLRDEDQVRSQQHRAAARVMLPLARRWRSHRRLERVVRRLGRPDGHGTMVLEARS